jgi:hypothetical protein
MPVKKSKSMAKMPARRMPEGFEFPNTKKPMPKVEGSKPGAKKLMPKVANAKPSVKTPMSRTTTKAPKKILPKPKTTKKPEKMTPQDAAMKKLLEKKYGKIYG